VDSLIVVAAALVAILATLAIAVLRIAARYEQVSSQPWREAREQAAQLASTRRLRGRARASRRP